MYMRQGHPVHVIEITATEFRRDLFRILDRMTETGEPVRIRRKGKILAFKATVIPEGGADQRAARFDAAMALGVRDNDADYDPGDITDGSHLDWTAEDTPR